MPSRFCAVYLCNRIFHQLTSLNRVSRSQRLLPPLRSVRVADDTQLRQQALPDHDWGTGYNFTLLVSVD